MDVYLDGIMHPIADPDYSDRVFLDEFNATLPSESCGDVRTMCRPLASLHVGQAPHILLRDQLEHHGMGMVPHDQSDLFVQPILDEVIDWERAIQPQAAPAPAALHPVQAAIRQIAQDLRHEITASAQMDPSLGVVVREERGPWLDLLESELMPHYSPGRDPWDRAIPSDDETLKRHRDMHARYAVAVAASPITMPKPQPLQPLQPLQRQRSKSKSRRSSTQPSASHVFEPPPQPSASHVFESPPQPSEHDSEAACIAPVQSSEPVACGPYTLRGGTRTRPGPDNRTPEARPPSVTRAESRAVHRPRAVSNPSQPSRGSRSHQRNSHGGSMHWSAAGQFAAIADPLACPESPLTPSPTAPMADEGVSLPLVAPQLPDPLAPLVVGDTYNTVDTSVNLFELALNLDTLDADAIAPAPQAFPALDDVAERTLIMDGLDSVRRLVWTGPPAAATPAQASGSWISPAAQAAGLAVPLSCVAAGPASNGLIPLVLGTQLPDAAFQAGSILCGPAPVNRLHFAAYSPALQQITFSEFDCTDIHVEQHVRAVSWMTGTPGRPDIAYCAGDEIGLIAWSPACEPAVRRWARRTGAIVRDLACQDQRLLFGGFEGRLYEIDTMRETDPDSSRFQGIVYNRNVFQVISSVAYRPGTSKHASVTCDGGLFQVRDLSTKTGTLSYHGSTSLYSHAWLDDTLVALGYGGEGGVELVDTRNMAKPLWRARDPAARDLGLLRAVPHAGAPALAVFGEGIAVWRVDTLGPQCLTRVMRGSPASNPPYYTCGAWADGALLAADADGKIGSVSLF
eukprot:m.245459 g.245459  ORF g.245459 m.245459 type:complete len:797 (+) comp14708_c0_seq1:222-2612(+)